MKYTIELKDVPGSAPLEIAIDGVVVFTLHEDGSIGAEWNLVKAAWDEFVSAGGRGDVSEVFAAALWAVHNARLAQPDEGASRGNCCAICGGPGAMVGALIDGGWQTAHSECLRARRAPRGM